MTQPINVAVYVRRGDADFAALDAEAERLAAVARARLGHAANIRGHIEPCDHGHGGRGPTLVQLLDDIVAGLVNVVVVSELAQLRGDASGRVEIMEILGAQGVRVVTEAMLQRLTAISVSCISQTSAELAQ